MIFSTNAHRTVRIGCGSGFWGDSADGPAQLVRKGNIDYLVLDYLAEITMSILARVKAKKPDGGYATDFVEAVMVPLANEIAARKIKVVANAGGVNPEACRDALAAALEKLGVDLSIAVVLGDDVSPQIETLRSRGTKDLESGGALPAKLSSANAYLGALPIAEALKRGADVVITGRCVDSAVALGPLIAEFGWSADDFDKLAQGSLAGHVIECGAQATGGVFTDWREVASDWSDMGFPIAECHADGSFVVTKPEGTGGLVDPRTVGEQIVYEVHDPARYVLADVVCDFTEVRLEALNKDRVRVTGARGLPPTDTYKASLTYRDGFRTIAQLMILGHDARAKAESVATAILRRCSRLFAERGWSDFRDRSVEILGTESNYGALARAGNLASREVILKIAVSHADEKALDLFSREIAPSATAMAQGITGFAGGRPRVQPIVRLASCLVPKTEVAVSIQVAGDTVQIAPPISVPTALVAPAETAKTEITGSPADGDRVVAPLRAIAHGRSGDKGNTANIGLLARRPEWISVLREQVTEEVVAKYFAHFVHGRVTRYEWPGLHALNFVLQDALAGGGIASLRFDPQGKGLAQILLDLPVTIPKAWLDAPEAGK